jgi:hypothetical protein
MSFRQFGGLNFSAKHNIVGSNYNTSNNLQITQNFGQPNSYINFLSDISGNVTINGNLSSTGATTLISTLTNTLDVTGEATFSSTINARGKITGTSFNAISDYRIKKNIQLLDESYTVDDLKPVLYTNLITKKQDIGLIAHELQESYPFLVDGEKDGNKNQTVNYNGLISILINEIKWLKRELKSIKEEYKYLK